MDWLNYHHLLYFWVVAKEGTIAKACERLDLAQPTISTQLKRLEESLGEKLFRKAGRKLALTDKGQQVFRYADQIFALGQEMVEAIQGSPAGQPLRFNVGVAIGMSKLLISRLIKPAVHLQERIQLVCREGELQTLVGDLAIHRLDVVLSDAPLGQMAGIRGFNHALGECTVSIMGVPDLAERYRRSFPKTLNDAPLLLPSTNSGLRQGLDAWFDVQRIRPQIAGEFDNSFLMKEFGQAGLGVFPIPSAIETDVQRQLGVRVVGRIAELREHYYAISLERRLKHPAVVAISEGAKADLFKPSAT